MNASVWTSMLARIPTRHQYTADVPSLSLVCADESNTWQLDKLHPEEFTGRRARKLQLLDWGDPVLHGIQFYLRRGLLR